MKEKKIFMVVVDKSTRFLLPSQEHAGGCCFNEGAFSTAEKAIVCAKQVLERELSRAKAFDREDIIGPIYTGHGADTAAYIEFKYKDGVKRKKCEIVVYIKDYTLDSFRPC